MAWNVFKFCTALRALGSIMIVFFLGVIGVSYHCVVIAHYGPILFHDGFDTLIALVFLLLLHFLLVMILWSYSSVVLTDSGGVPQNWRPLREEKGDDNAFIGSGHVSAKLGPKQSVAVPTDSRNRDFCLKCNQFKPPRSHHCSVCKRCILKMDHHCAWLANCVGVLNYKSFLLFLFYTFLGAASVCLALLRVFIEMFNDVQVGLTPWTLADTFITFVLNMAFALSILGYLIMHITLVGTNQTFIEANVKKTSPTQRYDLGWKKNYEQVFGTEKRLWFIPAYSKDDFRRMTLINYKDVYASTCPCLHLSSTCPPLVNYKCCPHQQCLVNSSEHNEFHVAVCSTLHVNAAQLHVSCMFPL